MLTDCLSAEYRNGLTTTGRDCQVDRICPLDRVGQDSLSLNSNRYAGAINKLQGLALSDPRFINLLAT